MVMSRNLRRSKKNSNFVWIFFSKKMVFKKKGKFNIIEYEDKFMIFEKMEFLV